MPTHEHDSGAELFRDSPELAAEVLAEHLHVALPPYASAEVADSDLSLAAPVQAAADRVVVLRDRTNVAVFAIVVEIQRQPDPEKHFRWPLYWAHARLQYRCNAVVLVIAPDETTARWSRALRQSSGLERHLYVLGREELPAAIEPEVLRERPHFAVLAGLVRHTIEDLELLVQVEAALDASSLDRRQKSYYWDVILLSAEERVRRLVEQRVMDLTGRYPQSEWGKEWFGRGHEAGLQEGRQEGLQEGRQEGLQEGEQRGREALRSSLRDVLTARGWVPAAEEQERITSCQDVDLLAEWLRRAVRATALTDVFVEKANGH